MNLALVLTQVLFAISIRRGREHFRGRSLLRVADATFSPRSGPGGCRLLRWRRRNWQTIARRSQSRCRRLRGKIRITYLRKTRTKPRTTNGSSERDVR
jgi:hypothetical protein